MTAAALIAEAITAHFGVEPKQALTAAVLFEAAGSYVGFSDLARAAEFPSRNAMGVQIHWLRSAGLQIETDKTAGYRLAPQTLVACVGAIVSYAMDLRAKADEAASLVAETLAGRGEA
jgi:biotin operon repressor